MYKKSKKSEISN